MPDETTAARSGPGRPPSGADERIVAAAIEVLERDGYAGLTTGKVAARAGHNKALIAYHFGSKQGLVAEVTRRVGEQFSEELLAEIGRPRDVEDLKRGLVDALWSYLDRHEGQARIYFDLASRALVDPEIHAIVTSVKDGHRALLEELLAGLDDPPAQRDRQAVAVYIVAALEGLALERLDRGRGATIDDAAEIFVRSSRRAWPVG